MYNKKIHPYVYWRPRAGTTIVFFGNQYSSLSPFAPLSFFVSVLSFFLFCSNPFLHVLLSIYIPPFEFHPHHTRVGWVWRISFCPINYHFVNSFGLPIALWVSRSGISVSYTQFWTIFPKGIAIKLESIIWDQSAGNPKSCNNVSPNKLLHVYVFDVRQGLSFNPLSEVVCADQQVLLVSYGFRKRVDNVWPPLGKRPRARERVKNSSWLVDIWSISLTLIALPNVLLRFILHIWPPISLCDGSTW